MLWQHVVLCKPYGAENVPDCGCVWCVMLRETIKIKIVDLYLMLVTYRAVFMTHIWIIGMCLCIYDFYFSLNIVRVIKSRRMRWAGHVASYG